MENARITPEFSPSVTTYSASVDFTITQILVDAVAKDSSAIVIINSPKLAVGATTKVTVQVTATDGTKKVYTINVKRAQDPDYVDLDTDLKSITLDKGILSPPFNAANTEYVVWLPYESMSIDVSGIASKLKAKVTVTGGDQLAEGDNKVVIKVVSESGETKEYNITVKRAYENGVGPVVSSESESTVPDVSSTVQAATNNVKKGGVNGFVVFLLIVLGGGAGFFGGIIFIKQKIFKERSMHRRNAGYRK